VEHSGLFRGSALGCVGAGGHVRLPGFVRAALERRGEARRVVLGVHEQSPCLTGYDSGLAPALQAELERLRLRDEAAGAGAGGHWARAHRVFGLAEDADLDEGGRIALPPLIRRRAGIGELALFVGVGASFEIWDPHLARDSSDRDLRELAEFRLGEGPGPHTDMNEGEEGR
jgi:transcriptional regulator MraZ